MTTERGASLVDALVGAALGGLAIGLLAASVGVGVRSLELARGVRAQVIAVHDGLERLRRRPAGTVSDTVGTSPAVARTERRTDRLGLPDLLAVDTAWSSHASTHTWSVETEHTP